MFETVHVRFLEGRPVDRALTALFRQNKHFGGRDRRFMSNTIFGYYRWYGWLRQVSSDNIGIALVLGYLLDGNDIDDRVGHWIDKFDHSLNRTNAERIRKAGSVIEKADLISSIVVPVSIDDLNPELVSGWDLQRIQAFQTRPPTWLRLEKADQQSLIAFLDSKRLVYRIHERHSRAIEVLSPFNIHEAADYREGWVEVQDLSSQAVGLICSPQNGEVWWDACAGSGGKALHLSALMKGTGAVYASEIDGGMLRELKRRISKNRRRKNIQAFSWDGIQIPNFEQKPDGVLIDAPVHVQVPGAGIPNFAGVLQRRRYLIIPGGS